MSKLGIKGEVLVAIGQRNDEGELIPDFAEVGCYGKGFFAVHKTVGPDGETDEGWRITHSLTRFKVGPTFDTRDEALKVRDILAAYPDDDWEFFSHDDISKDHQRKLIQQVADAVADKPDDDALDANADNEVSEPEPDEGLPADPIGERPVDEEESPEEISTTPEEPAPDPEPEPDTVEVGGDPEEHPSAPYATKEGHWADPTDTDEIDAVMAEYGTDDGDDEDISDILASLEDYE